MKEPITSYVGLDIHKDSIAIAVAEAGRTAPRFIGTTTAELAQLAKRSGAAPMPGTRWSFTRPARAATAERGT